MSKPLASRKKAQSISAAFFLLGIALLLMIDEWWPSLLLIFGLSLATRQYLLGRTYDSIVSMVVFGGIFMTIQFDIPWRIFLPIFFTIAGIYILFREFLNAEPETEEEANEDVSQEIDEIAHK